MPLDSKEGADAWRGMGAQKRATNREEAIQARPCRPPEAKSPVDPALASENSPRGAYERQQQIERAAYTLASESLHHKRPDAGRLVAIHGQAAQNLTRAREEVLKLAEKERSLVSGDWVRKAMMDHDGVVAALIRSMPKQLAVRISPHDPDHADRELTRWVEDVCLATLSKTDPWK
jgi:hypothetical protein